MEWLMIIVIFAAIWAIGQFGLWLFRDLFDALDARRIDGKTARVLIYGFSELACELVTLLESRNIDYFQVESESQLDREAVFTHLAALSDSDLDNLMVSRIGERMMNIRFQFILCNEFRNDGIYKDNGMPYFHKKECSADDVLRQMFPDNGVIP